MEMMIKRETSYDEDTKLRLGLPGTNGSEKDLSPAVRAKKREFSNTNDESTSTVTTEDSPPPKKVQAIGWPPVRSYRKNCLRAVKMQEECANFYVKVSMDGAPYLRKIDLRLYKGYKELLEALDEMFKFRVGKLSKKESYDSGSEYKLTYEDKDEDWMLVGTYHGRCLLLRARSFES